MARYEFEGFCPNNSVKKVLEEKNRFHEGRLYEMWLKIGGIVVAPYCKLNFEMDEVVKLFAEDAISFPLMKSLIEQFPEAEKITVMIARFTSGDFERSKIIEDKVRENPSASLVFARQSEKIALIFPNESNDKEIIVQVWL